MKKFLGLIKTVIVDIVKGMFVGVANIIPGVSGGTLAVSMNIYDKMIEALGAITKKFKKSFFTLLPIAIGMVAGIGIFSFIIPHCLAKYAFPTCMCFAGLIVGGIPEIIGHTTKAMSDSKKRLNPLHILCFALFLAIAIYMAVANPSSGGADSIEIGAVMVIKLLLLGIVSAATMVIPGVSGSLLLMILGYYSGVIGSISAFLTALKELDGSGILHNTMILLPFGIGCIAGILLVSKLIAWLLKKAPTYTYCSILGLVIASPFAVLYKMENPVFSPLYIVIGILLFAASAAFAYLFGKKGKNN